MPSVLLGVDESGQQIRLGDIERRSGLYILGKMGMGKSSLLVNLAHQDIANNHSVFFLDPHGDAIEDLIKRMRNENMLPYLFDPTENDHVFGINLLSCTDTTNLKALYETYTRAYNVFEKIWEEEWGVWLQLILQNALWAFIEHGGYTLAELPMFLNPKMKEFRQEILSKVKQNSACLTFWQYEFFDRKERSQQERVDAALTRIHTLLTHRYVRDIVSQKEKALDFSSFLNPAKQYVLLFNISANLPKDVKNFIGTILVSELLHAIRKRKGGERSQFCIYVDEFQNFASADDFRAIIMEGRKFGASMTAAHVERFGQFADQQKLMGATLATANKVIFQVIPPDAKELAPEFAKEATTTETRLEPELVISQNPFWDLINRGHINPTIRVYINKYFRVIVDDIGQIKMTLEKAGLGRMIMQEEAGLLRDLGQLSQIDERRERLNLQNTAANTTSRNYALAENFGAIANTEEIIGQLMQIHHLSREQAIKMQPFMTTLHNCRLRILNINRFLRGIMENHILLIPGREQYAQFFIDGFGDGYTSPLYSEFLSFYLRLEFGDPNISRAIPTAYAIRYHHKQLEDIHMQKRRNYHVDHWKEYEAKNPNTYHEDYRSHIYKEERLTYGYWVNDIVAKRIPRNTKYIEKPPITKSQFFSYLVEKGLQSDLWNYRKLIDAARKGDKQSFSSIPQLSSRVLTHQEIDIIKQNCKNELLDGIKTGQNNKDMFNVIDELIDLFQLLSKPENHIKVPSGQYIEKQVHVRQVHDMTDEMAQELANLSRFTAYAKIIQENEGIQSVWSGWICTKPLPRATIAADAILKLCLKNSEKASTTRKDIEAQIRSRQEPWLRLQNTQTQGRETPTPPTSQPPPTSD